MIEDILEHPPRKDMKESEYIERIVSALKKVPARIEAGK